MGHQSYVLLCTQTTVSNHPVVFPKSSCNDRLFRHPWLRGLGMPKFCVQKILDVIYGWVPETKSKHSSPGYVKINMGTDTPTENRIVPISSIHIHISALLLSSQWQTHIFGFFSHFLVLFSSKGTLLLGQVISICRPSKNSNAPSFMSKTSIF